MNSILRQTHIKANNLRDFMHSYDSSNTTAVSIWAKAASASLKPGALVFIVEPVTLPFGLISFGRKEEEESLRVADLAIVVRQEDGKPMAISINSNTYDLRFLETLLEEKARKAVIDRKKFTFVVARPVAPLVTSALKELERLANSYAKGGSRRSFLNENAQPDEEPAMALLTACGVHMHNIGASNKQPLDIGIICYALFCSDNKQPDSNRTQLKSNFTPMPGDTAQGKVTDAAVIDVHTEKNPNWLKDNTEQSLSTGRQKQDATGFNLLQSWGGEKSNQWTGSPASGEVADSIKSKLPDSFSEMYEVPIVPSIDEPREVIASSQSDLQEGVTEAAPPTDPNPLLNVSPESAEKGQALHHKEEESLVASHNQSDTIVKNDDDEDVYKHLSEAITDLLGPSMSPIKPSEKVVPTAPVFPKQIHKALPVHEEADNHRMLAAKSFEKLPAFTNPLLPPTPVSDAAPVEVYKTETSLSSKDEKSMLTSSSIPSESEEIRGPVDKEADIFSSTDIVPDKLDDFQEPKIVMNEMASLMNKLESQVARASKKLAIKAAEIEGKLNANLETLLNSVIQEDKDAYAELLIRGDALTREFESLFDKLKTELAEKSASSREKIKNTLTKNQKKIQENEKGLREILIAEFKDHQIQFEQLVENQEQMLNKLVSHETKTLHGRLEAIDRSLEETSINVDKKLANYFETFEERIEEKIASLTKAFDYQIEILSKDVELSQTVNTEKLKSSKEDFFNSLDRLIKITEIALSRQVRAAQTEFFLPRLKERKQIIEAMIQEMRQTFAEHSFSQAKAQSEGAENSLVLARQQLKELEDERLARLDIVGRNQQAGLEEIFKSAANPLEQHTGAVLQLLKQAEQEINECEAMCNKLAEAYNLDSDPALTTLRQDVYAKVDSLKARLREELESLLDSNCQKLEATTKNFHVNLSAKRTELVQQVRLTSDKGLQRIRQAIHEAYNNVQTEREKYME